MKPISLIFLFFLVFSCYSQDEKKLQYHVNLECYGLEIYSQIGNISYAGQTAQFSANYPLGKWINLGVTSGIYYHYRESRLAPNVYSYLPFQASVNFHTLNKRFGVEFATGFPFKLLEYKSYIHPNGFWYKDVYAENPDLDFQKNELIKRNNIILMTNVRLKFRMTHTDKWFITIGMRTINYRERSKKSGYLQPEFVVKGIHFYSNLSMGLEYRF